MKKAKIFARKVVTVKNRFPEPKSHDRAMAGSPKLRSDVHCGIIGCSECVLFELPDESGTLRADKPIVIPTDFVLRKFHDILSQSSVQNVVLLATVAKQLQSQHRTVYMAMTSNKAPWWYYFPNDFHLGTYVAKHETGQSADSDEGGDFTIACVNKAVEWYRSHTSLHVIQLITYDDVLQFVQHTLGKSDMWGDRITETFEELLNSDHAKSNAENEPSSKLSCTEHLSEKEMKSLISSGKAFSATLDSTAAFFASCMCRCQDTTLSRVQISGAHAINRALHGDTVCIEILEKNDTDPDARENLTGRVRGILQKGRRTICGVIDVENPGLFLPRNSKFPKIKLLARSPERWSNYWLLLSVEEWKCDATYPSGHVVENLGPRGDKDVEAKVILFEHNIPHYDFSQSVLACLPTGEWIAASTGRRDMRHIAICSVDPEGCKDIDDALHCVTLENGNFEVGVHIADVSHFVKEGTELDLEARRRGTSVYLVDRRIDMLPKLFTENLCSLVSGEDRYTFSALFEVDSNCNLVRAAYCKGIVCSRASLSYEVAQGIIDNDKSTSELAAPLRNLLHLSKCLKAKRKEAGAVFLHSLEFKFKLDDHHLNPTDMIQYESYDTNSMIEEWMLFANQAVAQEIFNASPQWALLRRHTPPNPSLLEPLNQALKQRGLQLDARSSGALNASLEKCVQVDDAQFQNIVRAMATRCMQRATYISSGDFKADEYSHFGLALPIYTHFTSPIRRYADLLVHRQLEAAIGHSSPSLQHSTEGYMTETATILNIRHENAQSAGRDSQSIHTQYYVYQNMDTGLCTKQQEPLAAQNVRGYITRKRQDGVFMVLLPRLGLEGPIQDVECTSTTDTGKTKDLDLLSAVQIDVVKVGNTKKESRIQNISGRFTFRKHDPLDAFLTEPEHKLSS